jgi:2-oxoglutarate dehydrogenase E1 component
MDELNLAYVQELFEAYLSSPGNVSNEWQEYFGREGSDFAAKLPIIQKLQALYPSLFSGNSAPAPSPQVITHEVQVLDEELLTGIAAAMAIVKAHRSHGHLAAHLDPLGSEPTGDPSLDPALLVPPLPHSVQERLPARVLRVSLPGETFSEMLPFLRETYCGTTAYQMEHLTSHEQRMWLRKAIEEGTYKVSPPTKEKKQILERLVRAETFDQYVRKVFLGAKSFSLEGLDVMVPMLDEAVELAASAGIEEIHFGMAHRGRLNVLAHELGMSYGDLLREFEGERAIDAIGQRDLTEEGMGDVKYHLGAKGEKITASGPISLALASNPSHLEAVNPVVEGITRATQTIHEKGAVTHKKSKALAFLIHGDAAFPGQGSVAETLNLQRLRGYETGGTMHLIANNQVGFTTDPADSRSTLYSSDLAKGFDCPVIHVNADDPEAALSVMRLAFAYRQQFSHDIVIDLIGYRRLGHNETDEPAYTQPEIVEKIHNHPTVAELYGKSLTDEGLISEEEIASMRQSIHAEIKAAHEVLKEEISTPIVLDLDEEHHPIQAPPSPETAVETSSLTTLNSHLLEVPEGFSVHPKLAKQLKRRRVAISEGGIDFGQAEALAFASLLCEGVPVRLSGQDSERGTFGHRHCVLHDPKTGETYTPLHHLEEAKASFEVCNSPLSEYAVLGFEYGYAVTCPEALVIWEAQFGDFVNGAQIIIDQFITSSLSKWHESSRLTCFLPHGSEGNGSEHSSARLERWMQLAAENNIRIAQPTTAAQHFHLIRRQGLDSIARPLVVMTPKGLLRYGPASSTLEELSEGSFQQIINDESITDVTSVKRLLLCSGRVFYDLDDYRKTLDEKDSVAIARFEQIYPFPQDAYKALLARYPNLEEITWVQEEPQNGGIWRTTRHRLEADLPANITLSYAGRPWRASPAEGYPTLYSAEQKRLVSHAFA